MRHYSLEQFKAIQTLERQITLWRYYQWAGMGANDTATFEF